MKRKRLTIKPAYMVAKCSGGKTIYYWQPDKELRSAGWQGKRLNDDPIAAATEARERNTEVAAWRLRGRDMLPPAPAKDTLGELIQRYRTSRFFTDRAPKTRRDYDYLLTDLETWAGDRRLKTIDFEACETLYTTLFATKPSLANHLIVMLRTVFKHGMRLGLIHHNPASDVRTRTLRSNAGAWPELAETVLIAACDAAGRHSIGTAITINAWCGQRLNDLCLMPRPKDGLVIITQAKTKAKVALPVEMVPALRARIAEEMARQQARGVTSAQFLILSEETGAPYKVDNISKAFAKIRAAAARDTPALAAAINACLLQRLRHTAVTRLADAGVPTNLIRAVTGHAESSAAAMLDKHYLERTAAQAAEAFTQRLRKENG